MNFWFHKNKFKLFIPLKHNKIYLKNQIFGAVLPLFDKYSIYLFIPLYGGFINYLFFMAKAKDKSEAKRGSKQISESTLTSAKIEEKNVNPDFNINLEDILKSGVYLGHRSSKLHPKMTPYIHGKKHDVSIIDPSKTIKSLEVALEFIRDVVAQKGKILLVGTKIQIKNLIKKTAEECKMPYVSERWLGGTFTNFETIKKRIDYFKELERKKASGELAKYTKKERAMFDKELRDLETKVGGIKEMNALPQAIFVSDMKKEEVAIAEAIKKGIKVISIAHTNVDPTLADYPIPANDDIILSVKYILDKIEETILKAREEADNKVLETKNRNQK